MNKESISKLIMKDIWSYLSTIDTNFKETVSVYPLLRMDDIKFNEYFEILYVG